MEPSSIINSLTKRLIWPGELCNRHCISLWYWSQSFVSYTFKVILSTFTLLWCNHSESVYFCLALSPITVPVLLMFFFVDVFMCIPVWAKHKWTFDLWPKYSDVFSHQLLQVSAHRSTVTSVKCHIMKLCTQWPPWTKLLFHTHIWGRVRILSDKMHTGLSIHSHFFIEACCLKQCTLYDICRSMFWLSRNILSCVWHHGH